MAGRDVEYNVGHIVSMKFNPSPIVVLQGVIRPLIYVQNLDLARFVDRDVRVC